MKFHFTLFSILFFVFFSIKANGWVDTPILAERSASETLEEFITYTYDFQKEIARTELTNPPAYFVTIGKTNAASAGVVSYKDANENVSNVLTPYGVGQRNTTGVLNLNAFPKKATDYSVTWKQYNDATTGEYKTGVVLRADTSKVGTATTGYVQGFMEGYVLLPYKTPRSGSEFRIYKSTSDVNLQMLVNTPAPDFSPVAKQAVWYRASVSGDAEVHLTIEYSTDSIIWEMGAEYIDEDATFQSGATQLLWGLAISRTDFYFDNITFYGLAEDDIDTPDNPEEPQVTDGIEMPHLGGLGKHLKVRTPVGSLTREMIIYVPENLSENSPLLISLAGANQDGEYQANQAQYWMVADTAKFLTVYPYGINNTWDSNGDKDLDFMSTIIDNMYDRYKIDRKRVYLSGFSMGSMFTYYAANRMADKFAAFAPTMGWNRSIKTVTSSRPVPIVQIIGTEDEVFTKTLYNNEFWTIFNAFIEHNGCVIYEEEATYPKRSGTSGAKKTIWKNPETGIEMVLFTTPKGHWHSNDPQHIMSNLEIWDFCKRYSLDGLIDNPSSIPETKIDSKVIVSEEYFNLQGQKIESPNRDEMRGIYIIKSLMSDGSVRLKKIITNQLPKS